MFSAKRGSEKWRFGQQPLWFVADKGAEGAIAFGMAGLILSLRPVSARYEHCRPHSILRRPATGPAA